MRISWNWLLVVAVSTIATKAAQEPEAAVISPTNENSFTSIAPSATNMKQAEDLYNEGVNLLNKERSSTSELRSAISKLDSALQLGYGGAALHLAKVYFFGRHDFEPDYLKSSSYLSQCNDSECHFLLGLFHSNGLGGKSKSIPHRLTYYALAAGRKNIAASMALGWAYSTGAQVPKNCIKSRDYYFPVAEEMAKTVERERRVNLPKGTKLALDRGEKGNSSRDVVDFYQYNADAGDASSLLFLGQVFYLGVGGVERDMDLARTYFSKASKLGNTAAMAYLGQMDFYGEGIGRPNLRQAYHNFRIASKDKNAVAYNGMGVLYWKGIEVGKDLGEALKYFKMAAALDYAEANYNIGRVYTELDPALHEDKIFAAHLAALRGGFVLAGFELAKINMEKDLTCSLAKYLLQNVLEKHPDVSLIEEGNKLFHSGHLGAALSRFLYMAEQGNEVAQFNAAYLLDYMARRKRGSQEEIASLRRRALAWWSSAAMNGDTSALLSLGDYFYYGWGIKHPSPISAAAYYHKAIEKRSPQAAFNLAYLHQRGIGVPLDLNMARRYYEQAASLGKSNEQPEAWLPVYIALKVLAITQRFERFKRSFRELPPWTVSVATAVIFGATTIILAAFTFGLGRRRPVVNVRRDPVVASDREAEFVFGKSESGSDVSMGMELEPEPGSGMSMSMSVEPEPESSIKLESEPNMELGSESSTEPEP